MDAISVSLSCKASLQGCIINVYNITIFIIKKMTGPMMSSDAETDFKPIIMIKYFFIINYYLRPKKQQPEIPITEPKKLGSVGRNMFFCWKFF